MGIVKCPALSIDASGNVGPICFSGWRGMHIARGVWTGTYNPTPLRQAQNERLALVSSAWGGVLTADHREKWARYATQVRLTNRLGEQYVPTGFGIYMKLNLQRVVIGATISNVPLVKEEPEDPGILRASMMIVQEKMSFYLGPPPAINHDGYGTEYMIAGPYDSAGRKPIEGEWRILDIEIPPSHTNFVDGIANKWYWGRARQIWASGWVGNWFYVQEQWIPSV